MRSVTRSLLSLLFCGCLLPLDGCKAVVRVTPPKLSVSKVNSVAAGAKGGGTLPQPASLLSSPTALDATGAAASHRTVIRLSGHAIAPRSLEGAVSNLKGDRVVGSPLAVVDVQSGRVMKRGVTYYDGSYQLDVELPGTSLGAVVTVDLVDAGDASHVLSLGLPLRLDAAQPELVGADVTVGATALLELYRRVSGGATDAASRRKLAEMIAGTTPDVLANFSALVGADPRVNGARDLALLAAGLDAYVANASVR